LAALNEAWASSRNAILKILREIFSEWRKKIERLEGQFHLPIFDVRILYVPTMGDRCEGAHNECRTKKECKTRKTSSPEGIGDCYRSIISLS
jgi:hypothetical protein